MLKIHFAEKLGRPAKRFAPRDYYGWPPGEIKYSKFREIISNEESEIVRENCFEGILVSINGKLFAAMVLGSPGAQTTYTEPIGYVNTYPSTAGNMITKLEIIENNGRYRAERI